MAGRDFTGMSVRLEGGIGNPSRLGEIFREEFPEGGTRPKEEAFYGTHGHPEDGGDLLVGKVFIAP